MGQTIDIDAYGRKNEDGSAIEYFDGDAISNALHEFIMLKKGEILYDPTVGGLTDSPLFKVMTPEALEMLTFKIRNAITNFFSPVVQIKKINVVSDTQNRILQLEVMFLTENQEIKTTTIYVASDFNYEIKTYTDIPYTEVNLYNFCVGKKSDMGLNKLTLDLTDSIWKWGEFAFINFKTTDTYFDQILLVCNG